MYRILRSPGPMRCAVPRGLALLALAVGGTLFVIPTAGEVPIVQALTSAGLGPLGAGILFTTLPAISLPSLVMAGWPSPSGCSPCWRCWWRLWGTSRASSRWPSACPSLGVGGLSGGREGSRR